MRFLNLFSLCLVGALGCAHTDVTKNVEVKVAARTYSPPAAGGDGGTAFSMLCPDGYVVTGLSGGSGLYVDRVSLICSPLRLQKVGVESKTRPTVCKPDEPDRCMDAAALAESPEERARLFQIAAEAYRERARAPKPSTLVRPGPEPRILPAVDYNRMVSKVADDHHAIDGDELDTYLTDKSVLDMEARVIPHYTNGQHNGFKLVGVRPGSLYRAIGIRSGDIIRSINGVAIDTPNKALDLYNQLKSKTKLILAIERRGQPLTLTVDIDR